MNRREMLHAVVRHDEYLEVPASITIVAVVPTKEEATREIERLSVVNADKSCSYFWLPARFFPDGRGVVDDRP